MAKPGLISIGLFNVLGHWNQYILPVVLMNDPEKKVFAGLVIALLPVLIVYIVFQRQVQAGLTAGVLK
jgi:N-acetylglucosamine transport system permease protein